MREYPIVKTNPNRGQRKTLRKVIFLENKLEGNRLRKARREAKEKNHV